MKVIRGETRFSFDSDSELKQRLASLFHLTLGPLTGRIALTIKRDEMFTKREKLSVDATSVYTVGPPLLDPVKKVPRCGGSAGGDATKG